MKLRLGNDENPLAKDADLGNCRGSERIVVVTGVFFSSVGGGGRLICV